jgi:hypothetical protein
LPAKARLADKFPSRFCLLSLLDGDAAEAKSALHAMNFDETTARALVGTPGDNGTASVCK